MRRWRILLSVLVSAITVLSTFVAIPLTSLAASRDVTASAAAAAAPPPDAHLSAAHYVIFTVNRVPIVNINETGTLTIDVTGGNPSGFTYTWSFRGLANGQRASASGTGSGSGNANNLTLVLPAAEITSWDIPGFPEPIHVKTAYLNRSNGFFFFSSLYFLELHDFVDFPQPIVSGLPIFVTPRVNGNVTKGNHVLFESSFGSGSTTFASLPGVRSSSQGAGSFPVVHGF